MEPTSMAIPSPEQPGRAATRPVPRWRPGPAVRRFGYVVAITVNLLLLYLVFVRPGWEIVPFLTEDMWDVLPYFAASILIGIGVNLVWLAYDPPWTRPLGELVTSVVGAIVLSRFLAVFPFSFAADDPWEVVVRVVLVVGLIGCVLAVIDDLVKLVRRVADASR